MTNNKFRLWWDPALRQGAGAQGEDRDFALSVLEVVEAPVSPIRNSLVLSLCILLAVAIGAACIGHVDIYAIASGKIETSGQSRVIQPLEAGTVRSVAVRNGSNVHRGDLLVDIDPTQPDAEREMHLRRLSAVDGEMARRRAAVQAVKSNQVNVNTAITFPVSVDNASKEQERAVLFADLTKLKGDVAELDGKVAEAEAQRDSVNIVLAKNRSLIETLSRRHSLRSTLADSHWETEANVLESLTDLQRAQAEVATEEGQLRQDLITIASAVEARRSAIAHFVAENTQGIEQAEQKERDTQQELVKASAEVGWKRLTAPIDGTVQALAVTTLGQVVTPAERLMIIVPNDEPLEVEALVTNIDIGFVDVGQEAVIKVDAFPYTRYGTISGRVQQVSRDSLTARDAVQLANSSGDATAPEAATISAVPEVQNLVFPIKLGISRSNLEIDGRNVPLMPGLSCIVEIKTGQRSLISYVMSPLIEVTSESAHER